MRCFLNEAGSGGTKNLTFPQVPYADEIFRLPVLPRDIDEARKKTFLYFKVAGEDDPHYVHTGAAEYIYNNGHRYIQDIIPQAQTDAMSLELSGKFTTMFGEVHASNSSVFMERARGIAESENMPLESTTKFKKLYDDMHESECVVFMQRLKGIFNETQETRSTYQKAYYEKNYPSFLEFLREHQGNRLSLYGMYIYN